MIVVSTFSLLGRSASSLPGHGIGNVGGAVEVKDPLDIGGRAKRVFEIGKQLHDLLRHNSAVKFSHEVD
jgi:hypothetical protein